MKKSSAEISKQLQNVGIFDFEEKYAAEILQIQTESDLSIWSKNDYLNELDRKDSIFKIAQNADGKIVGFALVRLLIGNSNFLENSFDSSEILNIAVRDSFQKQGIGQKIFDEILKSLTEKNIKEIWLEVRELNAKAIAFYEKNGFIKQFVRKNYYSNPSENALILRCFINL